VKKNNQDPRVQEVTGVASEALHEEHAQVPAEPIAKDSASSKSADSLNKHWDKRNYEKMRKLSSFINSHYDSPNIMDIMKERRLHEIEEIDRRVTNKNLNRGRNQGSNDRSFGFHTYVEQEQRRYPTGGPEQAFGRLY